MTATEHRNALAIALANKNVNELLAELAETLAKNDALKAELASIKAVLPAPPAA